MRSLDAKAGELYVFIDGDKRSIYQFQRRLRCGSLAFTHERNNRQRIVEADEFEQMRSDGRIVRIALPEREHDPEFPGDIDPSFLLDPDEPGISALDKAKRRVAERRMAEARALRFYCVRFDGHPDASKSKAGLDQFIRDHADEARARGHVWVPSDSALRRALRDCGVVGERPLNAFFERRGRHEAANRWHKETLRLRTEAIDSFWSDARPRIKDVVSEFFSKLDRVDAERREMKEAPLERPSRETVRLWISHAECYVTYAARCGKDAADRRFRGHARGLSAERPLQFVIFDHTEADVWAALFDEAGQQIISERPWLTLAVDLKSRMILGAVLTFEPATLYAVIACLRQVVMRKKFLIDEFGEHKGATDGFGKPDRIVVDNGWEFISISFQVCCEAAGISITWAPIKTPQYKAYVERAFNTLNEYYFHRLEAGIPYGAKEMTLRGLNPRAHASEPLEVHQDRIWRVIVTEYHVNKHDGIEMAPARAWKIGIDKHNRPLINDIRALNRLVGVSKHALLTTEGVRVDGQRFHDTVETSRLLDALLRYSHATKQRKGPRAVGSVKVLVTLDPGDCSYINVWDYHNKRSVRLSNWNPEFSRSCSWRTAQQIKKFADEQNMAFHSDAEMNQARAALLASLPKRMRSEKFRDARKLVRPYHLETLHLVHGNTVSLETAPATLTGADPVGIPTCLPAVEREGNRIPPKAPRRGGAKASRKAAAARRGKATTPVPFAPSPEIGTPSLSTPPAAHRLIPDNMDAATSGELLLKLAADLD